MREVIRLVDILQPKCVNTYGVAPCTATGPAADKCFNTFHTCQDKANYDDLAGDNIVRWRFSDSDQYDAIPALKSSSATPQEINLAGLNPDQSSFGRRSVFNATFEDFRYSDLLADPYIADRTYDPSVTGTFFGKFIARNRNLIGYLVEVRDGFTDQLADDMSTRLFKIETMDASDTSGKVNVKCVDVLKMDGTFPREGAYLASTILDPTTNPIQTVDIATYDEFWDTETPSSFLGTDSDYYRFAAGESRINYSFLTNGLPTLQGTDATTGAKIYRFANSLITNGDAQIRSPVNRAAIFSSAVQPLADSLYEVLRDIGQIPPPYMNKTEWAANIGTINTSSYFASLTEVKSISQILADIQTEFGVLIYWNERLQKVEVQPFPAKVIAFPTTITDDDFISGSVSISSKPDERVSRYIFVTPTQKSFATINLTAEQEYSIKRGVKDCEWVTDAALLSGMATVYVNAFVDGVTYISFSVDVVRGQDFWVGDNVNIQTRYIQNDKGQNPVVSATIISADERITDGVCSYKAVIFNSNIV